jgi:hypothetical protein
MIPRLVVPALAGRVVRRDPITVLEQQLETLRREVERRTVEWHPNAAVVTRALAACAATGCATGPVLEQLTAHPSSVLSRYARAGLPSVKAQSLLFRTWLALAVHHGGVQSTQRIAGLLNHSSAQSFCRAIRQHHGLAPSEFFARLRPEAFWIERVDPVMRWGADAWVTLDALDGSAARIAPAGEAVRYA